MYILTIIKRGLHILTAARNPMTDTITVRVPATNSRIAPEMMLSVDSVS